MKAQPLQVLACEDLLLLLNLREPQIKDHPDLVLFPDGCHKPDLPLFMAFVPGILGASPTKSIVAGKAGGARLQAGDD